MSQNPRRGKSRVLGRIGTAASPDDALLPLTDRSPAKRHVSELAICGGVPAFSQPVVVGRPNIAGRQQLHALLDQILDTRRLTNHGPLVSEFEQRICTLTGARHCIATTNATVALQLVLQSLGLEGQVIVPSFTFIATVHAVTAAGLEPVFADIDPQTHCLSPASVCTRISSETAAILATHVWGQCAAAAELCQIARQLKIPIIFDAAHALGCGVDGQWAGRNGDAEVFSFHATKVAHSFEGGAITTNKDALAERLRLARNFGFAGTDRVVAWGTNAKMHEMSAAMGLVSLDHLPQFVEINRRHHATYANELAGLSGVRLLDYSDCDPHNYHYVVLEVDSAASGIHRDVLLSVLQAENVLARRYFYPGCHQSAPYHQQPTAGAHDLPWTEHMADRVLVLPTGPTLETADVWTICQIVRLALANAGRLRGVSAA